MRKIVIVCAGSQGAVVADIIQCAQGTGRDAEAVGFVDDTVALQGTEILGLPVLGPVAALHDIVHDGIVVAIGDNLSRRLLTERLIAAGENLVSVIHPSASVARSAHIGPGSMVAAGALVMARTVIGRGVLLNTKSSVDHDCRVEAFAHIAPGATLGGKVRIGSETLIALGASVVSGRCIGARTIIGAGACVVADIPDDVVAWGVPARVTSVGNSGRPCGPPDRHR